MTDPLPSLVPETTTNPVPETSRDFSPSCPFCTIASCYPPVFPRATSSPEGESALDPEKVDPASFVLFSGEHVVAFLDIMPLTRGHVLVAPRKHRVKIGDLSPDEGAEMGRLLPLLARSVLKAVLPDIPHEEADYNIVQNNGPGAAQVVPHVHFHIVPRPPLEYQHWQSPLAVPTFPSIPPKKKYPQNPQPSGRQRTAILFGRGMRDDLDDEDAATLVGAMRSAVRDEWERSFGAVAKVEGQARGDVKEDGKGGSNPRRGPWKV